MSDKSKAEFTAPEAEESGTVREYRMRATDAWVTGEAQYVHLVAIDDPEVCVDTTLHDPAQHLTVGQEYVIRVTVGTPIPDGS